MYLNYNTLKTQCIKISIHQKHNVLKFQYIKITFLSLGITFKKIHCNTARGLTSKFQNDNS